LKLSYSYANLIIFKTYNCLTFNVYKFILALISFVYLKKKERTKSFSSIFEPESSDFTFLCKVLPNDIFHDDSIDCNVSSCQYIFIDKFFFHELIEDVLFSVFYFWQKRMVRVYLLFQRL
jgi:hypothetical protein